MAENDPSRRQMLTLQAVNPIDGKPCEVLISYDRMQAIARRGMSQAKECAYIVPAVLQAPTAIFEGLRRDEDEDRRGYGWRCYCGIPTHSYRQDGTEAPPYRNQVFLVFVNDAGVAYNWRWERADPDDPKLPAGHAERFKKRLL